MYSVSIIVPVYNGAKFLHGTIEDILKAAGAVMQVVLVDDGSTDSSREICRAYSTVHENVKLVCKKNGGVSSAREFGVEHADGDYIAFCDQDDVPVEGAWEAMRKRAEETGSDVVLCSTARLVGKETVPFEVFDDEVFGKERICLALMEPVLFASTDFGLSPEYHRDGTIWKCLIRRNLIRDGDIHFRRYVSYEDDLLYFLDVLSHAKRVSTMSMAGYQWRVNLRSETYSWKYVPRFTVRYSRMVEDITRMLKLAGAGDETILRYRQYELCLMYHQACINEASPENPRPFLKKMRYLQEVRRRYGLEDALDMEKHVWRTSVHRKGTLILARNHLWVPAYIWAAEYKKTRELLNRSSLYFRLERLLKKLEQ